MEGSPFVHEAREPRSSRPLNRISRRLRQRWRFSRSMRERRANHSGVGPASPGWGIDEERVLRDLDRDGCTVVEDVIDPAILIDVRAELEAAMVDNRLLPVLRGRGVVGDPKSLTPEEVARGDAWIRERAYIVYVADPFVTCPSALPLALSPMVARLAECYYGCAPALTAGKVMRSYANDLPLLELNWFHYDSQASHLLKFFMYLTDVEPGGGAFCYVPCSHKRKPWGALAPEYLSDDEVREFYGEHSIRELVARRGSVVIADTAGYHRAGKPVAADRDALLVTTGVHPFHDPVRLPRTYVDGLPPELRPLTDLAELV